MTQDSSIKMPAPMFAAAQETQRRGDFVDVLKNCPIPDKELLSNLELFLRRQALSRILFVQEVYQKIISVNGVIAVFGFRWGRNLALLSSLRGIYEPFNYTRKIIGFDAFEGITQVSPQDGTHEAVAEGMYGVTPNYESYLDEILQYHESESPISHLKKYEIVRGAPADTLPLYLEKHPETIIALAYFDLSLYEPTKQCLQQIRNYITKGSVLIFDELNCGPLPGETIALREVLGLGTYKIQRSPLCPFPSYVVVE
jgi:hypothetical protein